MLTKGVFLLFAIVLVHKARIAPATILACGVEQLHHPPYSPHLTPGDNYQFRILSPIYVIAALEKMRSCQRLQQPGLTRCQKTSIRLASRAKTNGAIALK